MNGIYYGPHSVSSRKTKLYLSHALQDSGVYKLLIIFRSERVELYWVLSDILSGLISIGFSLVLLL